MQVKETVAKRPTETITGTAGALAVYGFCTQVGLPQWVAAGIAVVVLVVPYLISTVVDVLRPGEPGPASDSLLDAAAKRKIRDGAKKV